jgi:hypothetical protein
MHDPTIQILAMLPFCRGALTIIAVQEVKISFMPATRSEIALASVARG